MRIGAITLLLLLAGCKKDSDDTDPVDPGEPTGCDPVDPTLCALPFPSATFQVPADTPSGVRNAFGPESLPLNRDAVRLRPDAWNRLDGFSTLTPILTYFEDVSLDGVIAHDDLGAYLDADAKTVIVDAATGERVPHFVELDVSGGEDSVGQELLVLRPVVPLKHATTYVVGIRGLVRTDGDPVDLGPGFLALRDGTAGDADVESIRDRYDQLIFPTLSEAGFPRQELQRAWSFTTISVESSVGDALHMRDDALERVQAGPSYSITKVEDGDCKEGPIARTIEGTVTVPRYTEKATAPTLLARGDDGKPVYVADVERGFLIRVPCSVALNPDPEARAFVLQYGHGMLGERFEANTSWLAHFLDDMGWIVFAMDWTGMSSPDVGAITLMLASDVSDFAILPERSQQGFVEKMVGLRALLGPMADDPALVDFTSVGGRDAPVVDTERFGFYGISQGGIMGASYVALSPDIERGVLGVPGSPYSILLSRSANFDPFFLLFKNKYEDQREIMLIIGLIQTLWDPGEGAGFATFLDDTPLPGSPPKQMLIQAAIGDAQVTTLGAHIMARAYGAKSVGPAVRPIWGVEEASAPFTGSAIVEWLYEDGSVEPFENVPPSKSQDTHECPRREPAGQLQIQAFLERGVVEQHCDGECVSTRVETGCD